MRLGQAISVAVLLCASSTLQADVVYTVRVPAPVFSFPSVEGFVFSAPDFQFLEPLYVSGHVLLSSVRCNLLPTGTCLDGSSINLQDQDTVSITAAYAASCLGTACILGVGADFLLNDLYAPGIHASIHKPDASLELSVVNAAPEPRTGILVVLALAAFLCMMSSSTIAKL